MAFVGNKTKPQREIVTRRDIQKYAVATSNRQEKYLSGDEARQCFTGTFLGGDGAREPEQRWGKYRFPAAKLTLVKSYGRWCGDGIP